MQNETSGIFNYLPEREPNNAHQQLAQLAAEAAVEPILRRWRHRCTDGLIDDKGKIRNVFTQITHQADDNVSRVIEELNQVPEALAEFEAALAAQRKLQALSRQSVEMRVRNARLLADAGLERTGFQLEAHTSAVTDWQDGREVAEVYYDEINELVKRVTGATHTFSNNHLLRQSEPEVGGNGPLAKLLAQSRGPVLTTHNDFAESYGEGGADLRQARRLVRRDGDPERNRRQRRHPSSPDIRHHRGHHRGGYHRGPAASQPLAGHQHLALGRA